MENKIIWIIPTTSLGRKVDCYKRLLKNFCYDHEFRMERTVSGTTQHNGVAGHMNQTLIERAIRIWIDTCMRRYTWKNPEEVV